jgi:hypothetical protein
LWWDTGRAELWQEGALRQTLTGNICFSVYKNDARSLLLIYQATLSPAIDKTPVFFKVR